MWRGLVVLLLLTPAFATGLAPAEEPGPTLQAMTREEALALLAAPETRAAVEPPSWLPPLPFGLLQRDCGQDGDAGGTRGSARRVPTPASCEGRLGLGDGEDGYLLDVERGDAVYVHASGEPGDLVGFCVEDASGTRSCSVSGYPLQRTATEPGEWFVVVQGHDGPYAMELDLMRPGPPDDCGSGVDAGDNATGAVRLAVPGACAAELNAVLDARDAFVLNLTEGEAVALRFDAPRMPHLGVCLVSLDMTRAYDCRYNNPPGRALHVTPLESGDHLLLTIAYGRSGPYTLSVAPAPPQDDCGSGADGATYRPVVLAPPASCAGVVMRGAGDEVDAFTFDLPQDGVRVSFSHGGSKSPVVCVFPPAPEAGVCASSLEADRTYAFPSRSPGEGPWDVWVLTPLLPPGENVTYALGLEGFATTPQDDCGLGADAVGSHLANRTVTADACAGMLMAGEGDFADEYDVDTAAGDLTVRVTLSTSKSVYVCIYASASGAGACNWGAGDASTTVEVPAGRHRIRIASYADGDASYALSIDRP